MHSCKQDPNKLDNDESPYVHIDHPSAAQPKKKNILLGVCIFILIMETAERVSYYGINQSLKNFLKQLGWSAVASNSIKSTWASMCYLTPILGAWIADGKWGRYKTIVVFGLIYCVGDFIVAFAAHPDFVATYPSLANTLFLLGLFLFVGVGTGAIKSNVVTLGADQFDPTNADDLKQREAYFSWFYFCINIGAGVSYGYLSFLCVQGLEPVIPQRYGYFATYLICAIFMTLAIGVLVAGRRRYRTVVVPPSENVVSKLLAVLRHNAQLTTGSKCICSGALVFLLSFFINASAVFATDVSPEFAITLSLFSSACCVYSMVVWIRFGMNPRVYLNQSLGAFASQDIEDTISIVRTLPFASFLVMWHCVYDQIDANFQSITQQCDLRYDRTNPDSQQLPGATVGVFVVFAIILFVPVLESVVYPRYKRAFGKMPSPVLKITCGLSIATLCMFWTGFIEIWRREAGPLHREACVPTLLNQNCAIVDFGGHQPMNDFPWYYCIPHYLMVGLCEILINVTAYDVFYSVVPANVKSLCQAVHLFMVAMGLNLTSVFTVAFVRYIPNDLNQGHLEYMYFAVGMFSFGNLVLFSVVMRKMKFALSSSMDQVAQVVEVFVNDHSI